MKFKQKYNLIEKKILILNNDKMIKQKFPQRVRRRYNQFAWLHERLDEKYPNICVPPLPGTQQK